MGRPVFLRGLLAAFGLACLIPVAAPPRLALAAKAEGAPRTIYDDVAFDQNLGAQVPLDLAFWDESGATVRLSDYFRGEKPVILTLVYYQCPLLCNQVLNGLTRSLLPVQLDMGRDFDVVTVSIDPSETPDLARAKKAGYVKRYGRAGAADGWHFLTGEAESIRKLVEAVGFRYRYDPKSKQYAHAAGIAMLTPNGKVSRYFYGIEYPARDLKLGLVDASGETIGSPIDKLLLICFHYDPGTGKYNLAIMSVIRVLGTLTAVVLGTFMLVMFRRERRFRVASAAASSEAASVAPGRPDGPSSSL